jgi:hypothetical protein
MILLGIRRLRDLVATLPLHRRHHLVYVRITTGTAARSAVQSIRMPLACVPPLRNREQQRARFVVIRTKAAPSPRARPSPARLWPRIARFEALVKVARYRGHQRANLAIEEVIRGLYDARIDHNSLLRL